MKSTVDKNKYGRYASIGITIAIVVMLVLSGPVSAVTLGITGLDGASPTKGDSITFTVSTKINDPDTYVRIENFSLKITGATSREVIFSTDGTVISGDGITINPITIPSSNQYGYGYGYASGYNFGYGYGYGYGYGAGGAEIEYKYQVTLDTSILNSGTHQAKLYLNTGYSSKPSFESAAASFTVKTASKGRGSTGGGGRGVANQFTQTQIFKIGVANFYGDAGKIVPSIKIPGATGSITVKKLTSNPTNVNTGKHVFFYLDINAGDNANKAATITFRLSKDSINEADIDPNTIALYRFNNGNWEELETQWSQTVDEYEEYTAQTPGFSAFLLSEKGAVPTVTATPTLTPAPTEEIEEPTPTSTKKGIPGFEAFGLITGVLTAAYIIMRKRG
ncbi:MAG: PGF-pre-PGF domain-containing protein [Methanosarcinales archaeon]|nr:PGF-pre-PGF domain-containing protein [Methanosarcinales archaeon]